MSTGSTSYEVKAVVRALIDADSEAAALQELCDRLDGVPEQYEVTNVAYKHSLAEREPSRPEVNAALEATESLRELIVKIAKVEDTIAGGWIDRHLKVIRAALAERGGEAGDKRLRGALEYLADPESWGGDPHNQQATLYGHDTPFELARAALAEHTHTPRRVPRRSMGQVLEDARRIEAEMAEHTHTEQEGRDARFPVKLNDAYACQFYGEAVVFGDLLAEDDRVASVVDDDGNEYGPYGVVVKREDGLWIVAESSKDRE